MGCDLAHKWGKISCHSNEWQNRHWDGLWMFPLETFPTIRICHLSVCMCVYTCVCVREREIGCLFSCRSLYLVHFRPCFFLLLWYYYCCWVDVLYCKYTNVRILSVYWLLVLGCKTSVSSPTFQISKFNYITVMQNLN